MGLRQPFAKIVDRTPEPDPAEDSIPLNRMIESGDFKMDLVERTVTLRGRELRLTSQEFDVLVFLAGHPKNVVTPRTVLATSWPTSQLRQTAFLRALISLRNKLHAAGPDQSYLRTEPFVIYRFDSTSSSAA
jgi:DNA-binding response OmpR family regulator